MFAGSGPLALAFPAQLRALRRERRRSCSRPGPRPGPRDAAAARARPRAATRSCCATPPATARRCCALASRCATGASSCGPRATAASRSSSTPPSTPTGGSFPAREERVAADALCVGYGFFPSVELLRLAGCDFGYDEDLGGPVVVRRRVACARPSPGISAAGDGTGVAGSLRRGRRGAARRARRRARSRHALGGRGGDARRRRSGDVLRRKQAFRAALRRLHAVGPGIYELATDETVVCRCEEVTRAAARPRRSTATADVNVVKGLTRAGDGPVPGAQLPAPDRRDDRARATGVRSVESARRDAAIAGPARADRRDRRRVGRGRGFFTVMTDATGRTAEATLTRAAAGEHGRRSSSAAASPARRSRTTSRARASRSRSSSAAS